MQREKEENKEAIENYWSKIIRERQQISEQSSQLEDEIQSRKEEIINDIESRSARRKENVLENEKIINVATQNGDIEKLKEILNNMI